MEDGKDYVEALKRRLEQLKSATDRDRQEVRKALEAIRAKEEQVDYILKLLAAEGVTPDGNVAPMSVSDMAYEVLSRQAEPNPMHYRELADLIMAEGKYIPGQDPAANLISHLTRDERFVRTDQGTYGLAEWGLKPAKKRSARRRTKRE